VIIYGTSLGGAAVIDCLTKYKKDLSKKITIKAVILEKTFASSRELIKRVQQNLFSNIGTNWIPAEFGGKNPPPKIFPTNDLQALAATKLIEKISDFDTNENDPASVIHKIDADVEVITNEGGDQLMSEEGARILAERAKHGKLHTVKSQYTALKDRHEPEFNNPEVIAIMANSIKKYLE